LVRKFPLYNSSYAFGEILFRFLLNVGIKMIAQIITFETKIISVCRAFNPITTTPDVDRKAPSVKRKIIFTWTT